MRTSSHLFILAGILLAIAGSRILQLRGLELDVDEIWTIWQTFGSPREIIAWTPYDWPPLHYLALGAWKEVAGIHPIAIRYFSVLIMLPGMAFMYRAFQREGGETIGVFAMLAYAAMSYVIALSVLIRGYIIVVSLLPASLWLTQRYLHRPTLLRGILLGISIAAMFYTHLASVLGICALGLYSLVLYPRSIWRWWMPGTIAGALALPLVAQKIGTVVSDGRLDAISQRVLPPLHKGLVDLFVQATGDLAVLWAVLVVASAVAILLRLRARRAHALVWALWVIGGGVALYITNPIFGFFSLRYSLWLMLGLAAWVAIGASLLPRLGQLAVVGVLTVSLFYPVSEEDMHGGIPTPPMGMLFDWLGEQIQWGDVMVVDPSVDAPPEAWDYYMRVYFPHGLRFVDDPANYRRVWYVTADGWEDPELAHAVREGRVPGRFVGPWNFLTRLYAAPPDRTGVLFENGMRFHGVDIVPSDSSYEPIAFREGENVTLRLWWTVDHPVELDYSISLRLLAPSGAPVIQADGAPQVPQAPPETSRWQSGRFYVEERTLQLPDALSTGVHTLYLIVYQWWDNTRVPVPGMTGDAMLPIELIYIKAW